MKFSVLLIFTMMTFSVTSHAAVNEESTIKKSVDAAQTQMPSLLGILPFAEIEFSAAKVGDQSNTITGFTAGVEYTVLKKDSWSSNSKLSLKNFSIENSNLFYTNKIETVAFLLGQTLNFNTNFLGYNLQPFSAVELGYGSSEAKASYNFSSSFEGKSAREGAVMAEASVGVRAYLASNFVPYIVGGYRYYELKAMKPSGDEYLEVPTKADFTGAYGALGVGYQF
ncbi:MAG: hypothetical protein Q7U04_01160 [Bacteriovorax sp.]|nr:hypothetical protein [Bacteriovorax sp.]